MIEVALALAVATFIITGVVSAVLTSLNSAIYSDHLNQATQYSQQGMEVVRAMGVDSVDETYCLGSDLIYAGEETCTAPNIGNFIRKVSVDVGSADCTAPLLKVTVATYWADGKCSSSDYCHKSQLVSCVE